MSAHVIIMPASPALVAELAPADQPSARLRHAVRTAIDEVVRNQPQLTIDLVGSQDQRWWTARDGSFAAWGAPQVTVGHGHHLAELVQRYVLGADLCRRVSAVRNLLGTPAAGRLTLVAADGCAGMTDRAPLALLPGAADTDQWCRTVLATAGPTPWQDTEGILDTQLWADLATADPTTATLLTADTSTGVARYVAHWEMAA